MTVDQAIQIAVDSVKKMFAGSDHRLEEVELKENGEFEVTVSFVGTTKPEPVTIGGDGLAFRPTRKSFGFDISRTYKTVVVGAGGQVKAVRIRQIVVG